MPHEIYLRSTLSVMRDVQSDLFAGDIGSRKSFLLSCIVADSGCGDTDSHYSQDKKSGCQKTSYQSDMHYTGDSCYGLLHYEAYSGFAGCKGRFREFPDLQGIFTRMIRQIGIFIPVCFFVSVWDRSDDVRKKLFRLINPHILHRNNTLK